MIWVPLCLFYGCIYKRSTLAHNVSVQIVDLDGSPVGANIAQMVMDIPETDSLSTWVRMGGFDSPESVETWALTVIESSGRHPISEMLFIKAGLTEAVSVVSSQYSLQLVKGFQSQQMGLGGSDTAQTNAAALLQPIGYTTVEVSPDNYSNAPFAFMFGCFLHLTTFPFFTNVRFRDLAIMWPALIVSMSLILSFYLSLAFLGPLFIACPSVPTVICTVVACATAPELAPSFYKIFYAMPSYNGYRIFQYVVTGAYPHNGKHTGILIAEIVAMILLMTAGVWFRQLFVLRGIADSHGWFRGETYFHSEIP
ncbi:hypothetical protein DL89DRAFT_264943 [Linderina pennispora]|uniref:DUF3533 domain-containing protein n=1 Tax=Linderina pennispora TaxID=61395 RepID=A0A1Y1WHM0_9FUNG|nr:uncharacterized protein DL89DRAFT_264943 [Linderina pennispora]ORX72736.1 hypothetical protein DL89DRAFT_264943 [Linderina pennispora]